MSARNIQLQGKWKQIRGRAKERWGKLTQSDLDVIAGKQEQLVGKLQERYGLGRGEAEKQVRNFISNLDLDQFQVEHDFTSEPTMVEEDEGFPWFFVVVGLVGAVAVVVYLNFQRDQF